MLVSISLEFGHHSTISRWHDLDFGIASKAPQTTINIPGGRSQQLKLKSCTHSRVQQTHLHITHKIYSTSLNRSFLKLTPQSRICSAPANNPRTTQPIDLPAPRAWLRNQRWIWQVLRETPPNDDHEEEVDDWAVGQVAKLIKCDQIINFSRCFRQIKFARKEEFSNT